MADPFVAEIRIFGFNFAPTGWAQCDGQLMPISQNTALFSLLGTMYGGNGKTTFALPNLQGSAALQWGQGPGLTERVQGESGGVESVTLLASEIPAHGHQLRAATQDNADVYNVGPAASFAPSTGGTLYQDTADTQMAAEVLTPAGDGLPHNNMQPYLTCNFCIALQGVFPSRP